MRVVNPSSSPLAVAIGSGAAAQSIGTGARPATTYRAVNASQKLRIDINGANTATDIKLAPGSFVTVVLGRQGAGFTFKAMVDATEGRDDLKAELRFYNLTVGCTGSVALADGRAVFEHVAPQDSRRRVINPVQASLTGRCDAATAAALKLPALKSGDHYSLFLAGNATNPVLLGQPDQTE